MRRKILWLVASQTVLVGSLLAQAPQTKPLPTGAVTAPAAGQPGAPGTSTGQASAAGTGTGPSAGQAQAPAGQLPTPPSTTAPQTPMPSPTTGPTQRLTLQDAEALALKNNPQISVYHLLSLASRQVTREEQAAYYPTVYGSVTAVKPREGTRIAAGNLNNPAVYERAAYGLTLSQLITDFGRTNNLVATAALRAKAADMNALATAAEIKLAVDSSYYTALQNLSLLKVAEETVKARQVVSDQITTLYQNKLRSELDVSFANANLAQSKLLLIDAQNNYQGALSSLSQILGYTSQQPYELVDPANQITAPPQDVAQLQDQAFSNRPEIAAQSYEYQAAQKFQKAQRDELFPSIEALGVVGRTPYSNSINGVSPFTDWYGAIGVNLNVPIFQGFLYPARSKEAALRAQASSEQLRDLKDKIANDVRTAWLNSINAYNRIGVSQQFVDQTALALNLSQTRYNLGLSSIVELSQAQLQQTEAQIQFAGAKYQYQIAESVLRFQIAAP